MDQSLGVTPEEITMFVMEQVSILVLVDQSLGENMDIG